MTRIKSALPVTVILSILGILVIYPVFILLYGSFLALPPRPGVTGNSLTLDNYIFVFSNAGLRPLLNTLIVGVTACSAAVTIGITLAWLAARTDVPGKGFAQMSGIMPLFLPSLVGALAWSLIASPNAGYLNMALAQLEIPLRFNIYSLGGIIFVLALYYAPYSFLFVYTALKLVNPEIEEAAEVHGASRWKVFSRISLPAVQPAVIGSVLLTFILVIDNFPIPMVLGTPGNVETLPASIYNFVAKAPSEPNRAAAFGTILTLIVFLFVYLQRLAAKRRDFVTVSGKGFSERVSVALGPWRWPAFAFIFIYGVLAVGFPIFALVQSSLRNNPYISRFTDLFDVTGFSTKNWIELFSYEPFQLGLQNSVIVGIMASVTGTAAAFILSYVVYRSNVPGRRMVEYGAMLPIAVPALVLGLGILWAWLALPLNIFGTLSILVIAYVAHFLPEGFRSISASIMQVSRDLEEAADISGASRIRVLWHILLPIVRPSVVATAILLFVLSLRELTASVFLVVTDTRTLAVVLFEQWSGGRQTRVASFSLAYCLILFMIILVGRRWLKPANSQR